MDAVGIFYLYFGGIVVGGMWRGGVVALPDEAQALESQEVVDVLDVLRSFADHGAKATGGEDLGLRAQFVEQKFEDAVDQTEVTVVEAGLQAAYGVGADHAGGLANFYAWQAGSAREECVGGDADAGADDSAQVFAFGRDAVEGGGGAEVDDHAGASVFIEGGDGVDDAVGADFGGIVIVDGHAGLDAGLDEQWFRVEVALADLAQHGVERGHYRRDHDAVNAGGFKAGHGKKIAEEDAVFVNGAALPRSDAPVGYEALVARRDGGAAIGMEFGYAGKNSEDGVSVADIENEEHVGILLRVRGRW